MADTTQQQASQRSLVTKMAEIMGLVGRIPKNGKNDHFGYKYAMEADIVEAVRSEFAARHLLLVPDVERVEWHERSTSKGNTDRIATLTVKYTLMDGDSGESLVFHGVGEGQDPGDKAVYKAQTGALKYALLKMLMIATGDDPEKDSTKPPDGAAPHREEKQRTSSSDATLIRFGSCKDKHLSEISDKDLAWYADRAAESVAKNDEKWHAKNVAWRDKVMDEQERRKKPATSPQEPATQPAQKGSPFERAVAKLDGMGVPYAAYSAEFKKRGVQKGKDVTEEIAAAVVSFFSGDGPPPPGDDDAPGGAA